MTYDSNKVMELRTERDYEPEEEFELVFKEVPSTKSLIKFSIKLTPI